MISVAVVAVAQVSVIVVVIVELNVVTVAAAVVAAVAVVVLSDVVLSDVLEEAIRAVLGVVERDRRPAFGPHAHCSGVRSGSLPTLVNWVCTRSHICSCLLSPPTVAISVICVSLSVLVISCSDFSSTCGVLLAGGGDRTGLLMQLGSTHLS